MIPLPSLQLNKQLNCALCTEKCQFALSKIRIVSAFYICLPLNTTVLMIWAVEMAYHTARLDKFALEPAKQFEDSWFYFFLLILTSKALFLPREVLDLRFAYGGHWSWACYWVGTAFSLGVFRKCMF